jgi:hypothetical protein
MPLAIRLMRDGSLAGRPRRETGFTVVVEDSGDGASVHVAVPNYPRPPDRLPPLTQAIVPLPQ